MPVVGVSSVEDSLELMGVKPMAIVISNTNYSMNHLRSLKAYRPAARADAVASALTVRNLQGFAYFADFDIDSCVCLQSIGFFVERHSDLGQKGFVETVKEFQSRTGPDTMYATMHCNDSRVMSVRVYCGLIHRSCVFYYSGHGCEASGKSG